jgi:hypothetical protein
MIFRPFLYDETACAPADQAAIVEVNRLGSLAIRR